MLSSTASSSTAQFAPTRGRCRSPGSVRAPERTELPLRGLGLAARLITSQTRLSAANLLLPLRPARWRNGIESSIALHALQFVVAHEAAHVMLGHHNGHPERLALGGLDLDLPDARPDLELQADALAMSAMLGDQPDEFRTVLLVLGIAMALESLALVEAVQFLRPGRSHPPASARWRQLVAMLRPRLPNTGEQAELLFTPLQRLLKATRTAALEDLRFTEAWPMLTEGGWLDEKAANRDSFAVFDLLNGFWHAPLEDHHIAVVHGWDPSQLRPGMTHAELEEAAEGVIGRLALDLSGDGRNLEEWSASTDGVTIRRVVERARRLRNPDAGGFDDPADLSVARLLEPHIQPQPDRLPHRRSDADGPDDAPTPG